MQITDLLPIPRMNVALYVPIKPRASILVFSFAGPVPPFFAGQQLPNAFTIADLMGIAQLTNDVCSSFVKL
jgi:hypothetical protein